MNLVRRAGRLARALGLFGLGIALVLVLHPSFLPHLFAFLKAPRYAGALTPRIAYHPREYTWRAPDRAWQRLEEVAEGRRGFDAGDFEAHHRQEPEIARFVDFWSRDAFWRKPSLARRANEALDLRACLDQVSALTFRLDGLDAHNDLARHAEVFEAALRYVEELAATGLARNEPLVVLAQVADERLIRQALRHARAHPPAPGRTAALVARLSDHFRAVGDLRTLAGTPHIVRVNEFLLTEHESKWPARVPLDWDSWGANSEQPAEFWAGEVDALSRALAEKPSLGLAHVVAHRLAKERARLEPRDWRERLLGLLVGHRRALLRERDADFALPAFRRQAEWTALRESALAALAGRVDATAIAPIAGLEPLKPLANAAFDGPEQALVQMLDELELSKLDWQVAQVTRPEAGVDLQRARVEVVARKVRFHELGALLTKVGLLAQGGRGELVQLAGDARALRYEVTLARHPATRAPSTVHRVSGENARELARRLSQTLNSHPRIERLVVVRLPGRLECTAVVTGTSAATDTRRAAR